MFPSGNPPTNSDTVATESAAEGRTGEAGSPPIAQTTHTAGTPARASNAQTRTRRIPGRRDMKEYPLSEDNIREIRTARKPIEFDLALASALFGFAINVALALTLVDMSALTYPNAYFFWMGLGVAAFVGAFASWRRYEMNKAAVDDVLKAIETTTQHG